MSSTSSGSSSPTPPPPGLDLTFGLELEFSLAVLPLSFPDPHPNYTRSIYAPIRDPSLPADAPPSSDAWHNYPMDRIHGLFFKHRIQWMKNAKAHIASFLESHGFCATVTCRNHCGFHDGLSLQEKFDQEVWTVAEDNTITSGFHHGYFLLGMEINSPPLPFNESSLQKVRDVLDLLSKEYMILCDKSSSIHVHIGNSGKPFSLDTVKNFTMLAYTFENQLSQLHPKRYSTGPFVDIYGLLPFSPLLRQFSRLVFQADNLVKSRGGSGHHHALDILYSKTDVNSLVELTHSENCNYCCRLAYNLDYLRDSENKDSDSDKHSDKHSDKYKHEDKHQHKDKAKDKDKDSDDESDDDDDGYADRKFKTTIEFRQHRSHLDSEEVAHWITVCAGLVQYAEKTLFPDVLRDHCKDVIMSNNEALNSVYCVLCFIGCKTQAEWYYDMLKRVGEDREAFEKAVSYGPINEQDYYSLSLQALEGRRENQPISRGPGFYCFNL
ncbi:amidoligase enzyme protein [Rutstroemia sp. NJR-2017a WRK4]|nr:amidoligase enzyme protein [Rutstroemia sp. NJR-2017a WRK4]